MTVQLSVGVRNARLDAIETTIGTSPILELRTLAPPTDCSSADVGTVIAAMSLPADFMANASAGSKVLSGTWQVNASANGTVGHYRIKNTAGTVTHVQGTVSATSGGGDMEIQNTSVNSGQQITITTYTLTDGNA